MRAYNNTDFRISWVNIQTGEEGPVGGERVIIDRPGEGHWVAAIVRV